ncbi:peptidoglycan DD-metalloendopeptidase family protein [Aquincola sp. MAHUQ-54]|uniref:Peptidoglycan DD-metalloendopeptidase family protein n=1 Tax=Aquincola agrisoli TaxID=3119538 RepID=A0AAW9QHA4_9BURK
MDPLRTLARAGTAVQDFSRHHPRGIAAAVVTFLAGLSATAFGIAPLAPDASDLPQRIITEAVVHEPVAAQLEALAEHALELSRNDLTRGSDTADTLLKRLGVNDAAAAAFLRRDPTARRLLEGRAGKMVQVVAAADGSLVSLVARYPAETTDKTASHFTRLSITREGGTLRSQVAVAPLQSQVRLASGTIRTSFFASSDEARIPDAIAAQMAEMFAADIDFHRELRKGDTFSIVYEALTADGEPITWNQGTGKVLAAEFVNAGKAYQSVWYREAGGRGAYFGFDGQSKRRSFLASPMEFSRITSGFAMRFHPIQRSWRAHRGVDYGAPTGTAVRSVADGVVTFSGVQNGYGNVIEIRHNNERSTLYAHLSRIGVRKGERVSQGDTIGAVGATGWATGPHLHFEFKVNGQQQDPLSIAKGSEAVTISSAQRADFTARALTYKAQLALAETLEGAHGVDD